MSLLLVGPIDPYVDTFQGNEAVADHFVEGGDNRFYLGGSVDAFDDDGKVFGETEDVGGMEPAGLAEPFDPAKDGGTGEAVASQGFDDGLVKGPAIVGVGLANEYPEQAGVLVLHVGSLSVGEGKAHGGGGETADEAYHQVEER